MIVASNLTKRYPGGHEAVRDISFEISAGQMVLIGGHSGAGKTTLVKLIASIERPTAGSLVVNGQNLSALRRSAIPYVRRHFGLVFQDQKLLFDRSALDNVLLPLLIAGLPRRDAIRRAQAALDKVGLLEREKANPIALSGGEQQRRHRPRRGQPANRLAGRRADRQSRCRVGARHPRPVRRFPSRRRHRRRRHPR